MPKKSKPKTRNCYCVKIPSELYDKLEETRQAMRHNKTAAVVTMIEAYLEKGENDRILFTGRGENAQP